MKLGKLKSVELRDFWKHESLDFTKWLAEEDNLRELGEEVGLDIELLQIEAGVGRFSADIVAQEETTGKKIVIENQLETTDHSHLGQILTYAAGIEAEYIIWIVKSARDEHKQAVEWLNEYTSEKINFFLIKIELWQIGDSALAPKFLTLSRPNEWTKSVRGNNGESTLSDTKLLQLEFWTQLKEYAAKYKPSLRLRSPRPQHWYDVAIGRSDCHIALTTLTSDNEVGCEIYINNSKELFRHFLAHKDEIERDIGISLDWQELESKKASRIRAFFKHDFSSENKNDAFEWLIDSAVKFKSTFSKIASNV